MSDIKLLDGKKMLFQNYQPKQKHLWYLEIQDGFPAYLIDSTKRPSRSTNQVVVDYINMKKYFAGKSQWSTFDISLIDAIIPSSAQAVTNWIKLQFDSTTGRCGYAEQYKKTLTLKLLGPAGDVVQEWQLIGCWVSNVDYGDLDWSSDQILKISLTLRFDNAIHLY